MRRLGICSKCGEVKIVQDHHIYGYSKKYKDEVVPYCNSCDQKAHYKARKEGKCTLNSEERMRLSHNSVNRRTHRTKTLSCETIITNILLVTECHININTEHINITSRFYGNHGKKLKIME